MALDGLRFFSEERPVRIFDFDGDGPTLGPVRLVARTEIGFFAHPKESLEQMLAEAFGHSFDCTTLTVGLETVCRALNHGDLAKAAIATQFLPLPKVRAEDTVTLVKASPEDPKHPGWPKGAPDGQGGEFRPHDSPSVLDMQREKSELRGRKAFRSVIRRVLAKKRAARLVAEWVGDAIPGIDEATGPLTIADDMALARDIAQDIADAQTALDFAEKGPQALDSLLVSQEKRSFSSYGAFIKLDGDVEVEKFFGRAGDDMQYHHIVEQGQNAGIFTSEQLNSTSNIIKIPKILHEDINAIYNSDLEFSTGTQTLRAFLKGKSFEQQRAWGLWALEQIGAIH